MRSTIYASVRLVVPILALAVAATLVPNTGCGVIPAPESSQEALGSVRGDMNDDGVVDQADLDLATAAFGLTEDNPDFLPAADFNEDGVIGLDDLQTLVGVLNAQGNTPGN
jgi:hypothetical protein